MIDWRLARCVGHDPELWFPLDGDWGLEAKALCSTCPIREDCLEYAITHGDDHGIWGGVGGKARVELRKKRSTRRRQFHRGTLLIEQRDEQIAALTERGWSAREIARHLKIPTERVYRRRRVIRQRGVWRETRSETSEAYS